MSTSENTTTVIVHEAINEEYEYIQYNKQLRLIRSVKDDMYQMQSIMNALRSTKQAYHWFENQQTKELLEEFPHMIASLGKPGEEIPYENRKNLAPGLKGYYVHRLLVNAVAMWASPRYACYIFMMLDELYKAEREEMEMKLQAKDEVIESKDKSIQKRIPRSVPKGKEKSYKYMIYTEELEKEEDKDM
ncbi:KilA, N-terminal/APSES-type HTH, DNA-binding family, partial [Trichomonas vaginalis G3]|uniref:KilA, N-terminal/APSES-type HTH, DNA-binding family n=1 Tax=Trichomonas vaginalis (strain ATCC PRA-98 / G3) TaxID=412133 RepID=UPI0021E5447E